MIMGAAAGLSILALGWIWFLAPDWFVHKYVRLYWTVLAVLALLMVVGCQPAHADPKVITLENCAKVETEVTHTNSGNGDRYAQTVRCIGDKDGEPKVKEPSSSTFFINPITGGNVCGGIPCLKN